MAKSIGSQEFDIFTAQLRQLLASDFPLAEGLEKFAEEIESDRFKWSYSVKKSKENRNGKKWIKLWMILSENLEKKR